MLLAAAGSRRMEADTLSSEDLLRLSRTSDMPPTDTTSSDKSPSLTKEESRSTGLSLFTWRLNRFRILSCGSASSSEENTRRSSSISLSDSTRTLQESSAISRTNCASEMHPRDCLSSVWNRNSARSAVCAFRANPKPRPSAVHCSKLMTASPSLSLCPFFSAGEQYSWKIASRPILRYLSFCRKFLAEKSLKLRVPIAIMRAMKVMSPTKVSSTKYSAAKLFSGYSGCRRYSTDGRDSTQCRHV
mmetsp:Transcript_31709/g.43499  ORF Transcript_31709/g.43499 Transcript_31709/m.43499 type:complete len:245 (+) Transcript_31709:1966-2700(+)